MKCPRCGAVDSKVIDSRSTDDFASIRRRRSCPTCGYRFTTYEVVDKVPVTVVKKNGTKELFDRNKVLSGILRACNKRTVTREQMESVVTDVEAEIQNSLDTEITSSYIADLVMDRLKAIDEVSYVRFASVHREFKDAQSFLEALEEIRESKKPE